ncbi:uncharacterized protein LOC117923373 [Vitis riparia]|uniref:uncharacterized protein LOC117923373 n=1 Tax=Vitis riparia TaxID=96939 RepID=UPI00155A532B|nr:uncharacterized protein LOC117923373 [Vitis riparia]
MAFTNCTKQKKSIEELYEALKEENEYVARVCANKPPEDPFQVIDAPYNNTFLHMAIRFKQKDLVNEVLGTLPGQGNHQPSKIKNNGGNTILHEVACCDSMKDVAKEVLKKYAKEDRDLLIARNNSGETPIFCAARYGQTEMFEFLAEEMKQKEQHGQQHLQRDDKTTVLHISITTEFFELAYFIADNYKCLIEVKDQDSMTALQYLACNPTAFERKGMKKRQGVMEELMIQLDVPHGIRETFNKFICKHNNKKSDPSNCINLTSDGRCPPVLQRLIRLLVEKTPSHISINSQAVGPSKTKKESEIQEQSSELAQTEDGQESQTKDGQQSSKLPQIEDGQESQTKDGQQSQKKEEQNSQENKGQNSNKYKKSDETPLFLATISNIEEIVKEILIFHPQMLEHTNKEGMNILQVAILYRHNKIFDLLVKSTMLPRSLLSATDNEGNSLLHMFGQKRKSQANEWTQNPAFQLRKELLFFQEVKQNCKMHLTKPLNKDHQTAEELFAASNETLHREAKDWLMRATENSTILSVFIATVAFAAAYTVPGGPDQTTGIPILHFKPFFVVFILADVISLTSALTSVGIFLSILTSSFPLQHFKTYLFKKLTLGIKLMVLSVSMMAVAFGATIVLIMTRNQESVVWHVVAFLPVPIFFLSYSPLRSAVLVPCSEWLKLIAKNRCTESLKNFVSDILILVCCMVVIFLLVLLYLLPIGCTFIICKPVCWICGNKSQPKSETDSPQPTAAPPEV